MNNKFKMRILLNKKTKKFLFASYMFIKNINKIIFNFKRIKKDIKLIRILTHNNTFFGYYGVRISNSKHNLLCHKTKQSTILKPSKSQSIDLLILKNLEDQTVLKKIKVSSYNWQQGCNPQWLSNNKIIYNDLHFSRRNVNAKTYNLKTKKIKTLRYPIQTVLNENSYFSVCCKKLTVLRIDYGYPQLDINNSEEIAQRDDYIKLVNIKKNIVSDLVNLNFFKNELGLKKITGHKFNHIMVSLDKNYICYIYRFFKKNMRNSVLCITDLKTNKSSYIKKLSQVSHYCWLSDNEILIFGKLSGKNSYFKYNILKEKIYHQKWLEFLPDGHPIFDGKRLVLDTYPDKNCYQNLYEGNIKLKKIKLIGSFFHNPLYYGSERCDLHPKFGCVGELYIDTIAFGKRNLVGIK